MRDVSSYSHSMILGGQSRFVGVRRGGGLRLWWCRGCWVSVGVYKEGRRGYARKSWWFVDVGGFSCFFVCWRDWRRMASRVFLRSPIVAGAEIGWVWVRVSC